jgi:hypothetical protein
MGESSAMILSHFVETTLPPKIKEPANQGDFKLLPWANVDPSSIAKRDLAIPQSSKHQD